MEDPITEGRERKKREIELPSGSRDQAVYRSAEDNSVEEMPNPLTTEIIQVLRTIDICEVYSPKRVTAQARKYGLKSGEAMDLTTGWDFRIEDHRIAAKKYVTNVKPRLLIGSPMCTMFSTLQRLSGWNAEKQRKWGEAREHIRFVVELYMEQERGGILFLHEHPAGASSWDLEEIQKVMNLKNVHVVIADQCMFGLTTWPTRGSYPIPAKKPTKFMTNSESIARELNKRCDRTHEHQPLVGGRAASAARYPEGLCRAICRGLIKDHKEREYKVSRVCELHPRSPQELRSWRWAATYLKSLHWDDVTGMTLDGNAVMEARRKELEYINKKNVWKKIPRHVAMQSQWKVISTRWVDINKGDDERPVHRSRLVGKEFNNSEMDGLFAGTPPLEALRFIVHRAATVTQKSVGDNVIRISGVARALFEAKAQRNVCVELPPEALARGETASDWVGHLQRSLYGTRDAAMNWQEEVASQMCVWGFARGRYNPCLHYHSSSGLMVSVHGDDFVCVGSRGSASGFKIQLEKRF